MTRLTGWLSSASKLTPLLGAAQRADDLVNQVRRGVRNADAEADAGAHRGLALLDHGGDGLAVLGLDLAGGHQVVDQLVDRFPAVGRAQSVMICSLLRMSPNSIASETFRRSISP